MILKQKWKKSKKKPSNFDSEKKELKMHWNQSIF